MLGASLRHRGDELLALPGGLDGYRAGDVTGLPLLAPWANRLGQRRYEVEGVAVDLEGLDLHTDDHGLPIHGTMSAQPGWEVVELAEHSFAARFDFGGHPELLASFPFPHELRVEVAVAASALRVVTTIAATTDRAGPRRRSATTPISAFPASGGRTSTSACQPARTSSSTTVVFRPGVARARGSRGRATRVPDLRRPLPARRRSAARADGRRTPSRARARGGLPLRPGVHPGRRRQRLPRTDDGRRQRPRRRQRRARDSRSPLHRELLPPCHGNQLIAARLPPSPSADDLRLAGPPATSQRWSRPVQNTLLARLDLERADARPPRVRRARHRRAENAHGAPSPSDTRG